MRYEIELKLDLDVCSLNVWDHLVPIELLKGLIAVFATQKKKTREKFARQGSMFDATNALK